MNGVACRTTMLALLCTNLLAPPVQAQVKIPYQDDNWHLNITPFAMLNGIDGVVKAGGETVDLSSTSLSEVQFGLHLAVLKKAWIIQAEGSYLKYSLQGGTSDGTPARLDLTQSMGDAAVGYSFGTNQRSFAVLGGVRYLNIKGETTVQGQQPESGSQDIWDPYLGLRFFWGVYDRVPVVLRADVGGFQISDVDLSWRVTVGAAYQFSDRLAVDGGWRWFDIEYKTSSTADQAIYDVRQNGPYLALTFGI
ncbi:MAG: outer membrane beta-barrel protein [Gemmatimonadota bacterium]|nr:MAG: outer membrane beta-barrel protein [Gemmatimonadota bacterium]